MNALGDAAVEDRKVESEAPDAAGRFRIWPGNGVPPGSEDWDWHETTMPVPWGDVPRRLTRNVVIPTLTMFRPEPGKANGTSLVIAPGGAFHFLMIDHEGYDMARWLTGRGVTAFVLNYRLGRTPDSDAELEEFRTDLRRRMDASRADPSAPSPMTHELRLFAEEDGRQAIRFVRQHAAEWQLDPTRLGIAGFSAGGGVAMGAAHEYDAETRPDFAVGIYPATRQGLAVPADAPPLFLVISDDDPSVPPLWASRLSEAWHTAGSPAELHVFGNGGHGYGMAQEGWLSDAWVDLLGNWLRVRGLLPDTD